MLCLCLAAPLLLQTTAPSPPPARNPSDPARDFDFWVGAWQVQNRHIQPDGTWVDGTQTRARITPVLDGAALLEQWAGPFNGTFMNGFSLRSYAPEDGQWTILLFWTTDGNASFGTMKGSFRHGRGLFGSNWTDAAGTPQALRYTFSDALANSVRWDSARSSDGGVSWKTDWIMEFSRTASASQTQEAQLFTQPWNAGALSPHVEARALDWMRGSWEGEERREGVEPRRAKLDATLMDKDCLLFTSVGTWNPNKEDWDKEVTVGGYVSANQRWEQWGASEVDPKLRGSVGAETENGFVFTRTSADGTVVREYVEQMSYDLMRWKRTLQEAEGEERTVVVREFARTSG